MNWFNHKADQEIPASEEPSDDIFAEEEPIVEPMLTVEELPTNDPEELNRKLRIWFDGKIVRKDLTKKIKEGANVPIYVLEYLLGMYCS
ncbi:MAG: hypothetical protein RSF86_14355, partial [Angelakisella sp.]